MTKEEILAMMEHNWSSNTGLGATHMLAKLLEVLCDGAIVDEQDIKEIVS